MRRTRLLQVALHQPADGDDAAERVARNRENVLSLLDRAADFDPDIVVFPELTIHHACRGDFELSDLAEPIPGPTSDQVAEKAAALDAYVVLPMYERNGDQFHNAAALLGPDGSHLGTYRKVAPTVPEMEAGIVPGTEIPVWETPHGRIGLFICWDARYPEIGTALGQQGVELAIHPTLGNGDGMLRTWARYNGYHVAFCDKHGARVFSPQGGTLGANSTAWKNPTVEDVDLGGGEARFSFTQLNTDTRAYARAGQSGWAEALQREYPDAVAIHGHDADAVIVVECLSDELTLDDLEAEFPGMQTTRDYEDEVRATVHGTIDGSPLDRAYLGDGA